MVILLLNFILESTAQEMSTHIQKVWELDKINHHLFSYIHVDHTYKYAEHPLWKSRLLFEVLSFHLHYLILN